MRLVLPSYPWNKCSSSSLCFVVFVFVSVISCVWYKVLFFYGHHHLLVKTSSLANTDQASSRQAFLRSYVNASFILFLSVGRPARHPLERSMPPISWSADVGTPVCRRLDLSHIERRLSLYNSTLPCFLSAKILAGARIVSSIVLWFLYYYGKFVETVRAGASSDTGTLTGDLFRRIEDDIVVR